MQKPNKQPEWHLVILGMALTLGVVVRIMPLLMAGFPLNDGGMFYVMIQDLGGNDFRLPLFTTYNLAEIPYAYPPFGFYVAALLSALRIPTIEILRWLPALVNVIAIYAVYLMASAILRDRPRSALAAAFYSLTPGGYGWFIMGGGLTRAFGGLFLVLSVYFLYRVFNESRAGYHPAPRGILFATLTCALAVLSHPEAGLHTAASCALVWIFWGRTRRGTIHALIIAAGTALLTAPWWLSLLAGHGVGPVISAFHTGMYSSSTLAELVEDFFARGSILPILLILRVAGLIWSLWKRQFFLAAWTILPYFVEPRSAPAVSFYPFVMLAALGLVDALPAFLRLVRRKAAEQVETPLSENKPLNLTVLGILFYLFIESAFFTFPLVNTTLRRVDRAALAWIQANAPADARFLILTGKIGAMTDPMQEWFPALAERRSQTTLQGLEWTLAEGFMPRLNALDQLQTCDTAECLDDWSATTGLDFTHLLLKKKGIRETLPASLSDAGYELIFENEGFWLYQK
ncbi:MAG: glycosyltransferase family 39 protein [Chloroflexota bacterium]